MQLPSRIDYISAFNQNFFPFIFFLLFYFLGVILSKKVSYWLRLRPAEDKKGPFFSEQCWSLEPDVPWRKRPLSAIIFNHVDWTYYHPADSSVDC